MADPSILDILTGVVAAAGALIALSTLVLTKGTKRLEILADLHRRPVDTHAAVKPLVESLFLQAFRQAFFPESGGVVFAIVLGFLSVTSGVFLIIMGLTFLLGLAWGLAGFMLALGFIYAGVGVWVLGRVKVRKKGHNDLIRDWLMNRESDLLKQHEAARQILPDKSLLEQQPKV